MSTLNKYTILIDEEEPKYTLPAVLKKDEKEIQG